jgi:hypothetical protein
LSRHYKNPINNIMSQYGGGCRMNAKTERCNKYNGPDVGQCIQGPNRCRTSKNLAKAYTPKRKATVKQLAALKKARAVRAANLAAKRQSGGYYMSGGGTTNPFGPLNYASLEPAQQKKAYTEIRNIYKKEKMRLDAEYIKNNPNEKAAYNKARATVQALDKAAHRKVAEYYTGYLKFWPN